MSAPMMTVVAAASPRHRQHIVCTYCGSRRETHGIHYCPMVRCDPPHDDRHADNARAAALLPDSLIRGVE